MRMTDEALKAVCEAQIEVAIGNPGGEISRDRAKAMAYFMADVEEYLPSEEGRSDFFSNDVADTVEAMVPGLMKIFMEDENAVIFKPTGPEDVEQARLETQVVRNVFFEQNDGFTNLTEFFKDALLSKTGIIKTYFEEGEIQRETYNNLTEEEYLSVLNSPGWEVEELDRNINEQGLIDASFAVIKRPGLVKVDTVPPEEFGVSQNCRSPDVKNANFCFHRSRVTASDLIEMGYERNKVEDLPFDQDPSNEERIRRYNYSDEDEDIVEAHKSMMEIWFTECYVRIDADDDGIAELLKISLAGETPGSVLLDREEIDNTPISTATPIILPHKAIGRSVAERVIDIADIKTALYRGILDNQYLANNPRTAANELVNFDDLLISRAGGVIRTEGESPPQNNIFPIQHPSVPPESFGLLEVMDKVKKDRTGQGDEVKGLDANALSNVNTGVMMEALEMARMSLEMIARTLGSGLKSVFQDIHEALCKNVDHVLRMEINGNWATVDPREWKARTDMKVAVGVGNASKQRMHAILSETLQTQMGLLQSPAQDMVQPNNILYTLSEKARLAGLEPQAVFTDPKTLPPKEPPPPPPEFINAQANMIKAQNDSQRLHLDVMKAQLDMQTKTMVAQSKEREAQIRAQMESLKSQVMLRKQQVDEQSQILNAMTGRSRQEAEERIAVRKQTWDEYIEQAEIQLDQYQAELSSLTQLRMAAMNNQAQYDKTLTRQREELARMRANIGQSTRNDAERTAS